MKTIKITLLALTLSLGFSVAIAQNQGVAINTDGSQADASALLDVKSTTGGVLVPRMDMAERDLIATPATGLLIYQSDNTPGFFYYDGAAWIAIGGASGPDGDWTISGNDLYNNNSGNTGIGTSSPGAKLEVAGHIWQTGTGNSVFLGENAGAADDLSGNSNVFIGQGAAQSNLDGENNVAIGSQSMLANTSGIRNIAIGTSALWFNGDGLSNISIGHGTSANNISGSYNTVLGTWAFKSFANTSYNTAIGFNACGDFQALPWIQGKYSGDRLTAMGYEALFKNQDGIRNTGVGYQALHENEAGDYNTALGYAASQNLAGLNNTTALGNGATPSASNQVVLGNGAVTQVKTAGGITVGDTGVTEAGTIRFDGTNFWGYNGSAWVQLDN